MDFYVVLRTMGVPHVLSLLPPLHAMQAAKASRTGVVGAARKDAFPT